MYDAIVVGLGPAGSTAAYTLAQAGLKVLGIDKARFPRYKSCGGCISTKIERILDFSISDTIEQTVYGATFTYKSERTLDIISERAVGHNVMRETFDNRLLSKAKEAGAEVIEGLRVTGVTDNGNSVAVSAADGRSFTGKVLVGADGASGVVGREVFRLNPREAAVSITAEVPYERAKADYGRKLFIDFGGVPYGYGWIFPKKDYLSVGIAGDAVKVGGRIKEYFNSFAGTHAALKGLKVDERVGWTVPIYYDGAAPSVKGRVLLIGDTGHLVDPFLGEGIFYAIRTAKAASSAIIDTIGREKADLAPYQAWLEREIYPEFKGAGKLSDLVYAHPRLWYSILEKDPEIMHRFYNVIRGEEDCNSFYDWVYGKIRSKPWKVLRRWIESRFLPV
ncbi:MAG: geranylgeranyl reductase family protein [Deltaproteobacteria bacterium]|nr:geranylgeranyl reductase family protein [Deltaproteobacteria bacterium]